MLHLIQLAMLELLIIEIQVEHLDAPILPTRRDLCLPIQEGEASHGVSVVEVLLGRRGGCINEVPLHDFVITLRARQHSLTIWDRHDVVDLSGVELLLVEVAHDLECLVEEADLSIQPNH